MGWDVPWFTTLGGFVEDLDATEWFAINVFIRWDDQIYRTFFDSGREVEIMGNERFRGGGSDKESQNAQAGAHPERHRRRQSRDAR